MPCRYEDFFRGKGIGQGGSGPIFKLLGASLIARSRTTKTREPRQVRKEATVTVEIVRCGVAWLSAMPGRGGGRFRERR